MKNIYKFLLLFLIISNLSALNQINNNNSLQLTNNEKEWLKKHPVQQIAVMSYWPQNEKGETIHTDLIKLINKYAKTNIKPVVFDAWEKGYNEAIKGNNIYGIMNLSYTKEREKYFYYSPSYISYPIYLITKSSNNNIKDFKDLVNKTILIKSKSVLNNFIKNKVSKIHIQNNPSNFIMYKELSTNKNVNAIVSYFISEKILSKYKLKIAKIYYGKENESYIGINRKYKEFASIINKSFKTIPPIEFYRLYKKKYDIDNSMVMLSQKEKKWLNKKTPITYVFDPDWAPFEWKNGLNKHTGILADILHLLSEKTGITFKAVPTKSWSESVALLKSNKVDMVSAITYSKDRAKYLNFSKQNIFEYPAVFVAKKNDNIDYNNNPINFIDKKIGAIKGSGLTKKIKTIYTKSKFIYIKSTTDGFEKLKKGEIDLLLINGVTANYYISHKGYQNMKITKTLDYMFPLKVGINKNTPPEVLSIIDKGLEKITPQEINSIYDKWVYVNTKKEINWRLLFEIAGVLGLVILFILWNNKKLKSIVKEKTKDLKDILEKQEETIKERTLELSDEKIKIEELHKHTKDSIEYASLIQSALIPDNNLFRKYFKEYFTIWHPKDIVGGDIYLFDELRHDDECLIMVIDCTGHGVPGAFVTMLVKAIERQIVYKIKYDPDEVVSPAKILSIFNKTMKQLLKQETVDSVSNAGFDGGIIYYNKKDKIIKFAGAQTPLFYVEDGELKTIKGNRYSVGYKKCDMDYEYKEHIINVKEGMKFYITTDGYLDQNGGEKDFPFGKKRFVNLIKEYHNMPMSDQQEILLYEMAEYESMIENNERNDDMTVIGFEI